MTLADVERMGRYWRKHPSTRMLVAIVAAFAGWKQPSEEEPGDDAKYMTAADARRIMAAGGGKFPGMTRR
jgi:hypothetical protein